MDAFEEILCDEVRQYPNLYNPSLSSYKDAQMTNNSWGEIVCTLGKEEKVCWAKWKYLRDRFVKIKKKAKAGGASGGKV
ncbi:transcription factor Adf-1-like [Scomber scombrus]|uniref:Transcription factor Adf-1-like n=1 Tax=Scomber scombrus TaxID=13677 RepID=A0AAV1PZL5_SCOSC